MLSLQRYGTNDHFFLAIRKKYIKNQKRKATDTKRLYQKIRRSIKAKTNKTKTTKEIKENEKKNISNS